MSIAIRQIGSLQEWTYGRAAPSAELAASSDGDSWLDALVKLIPGEIIVAFTAALRMPGVGDAWGAHVAILVILTAMAPLVLWSSVRRAGTHAHWLQYVVRSAAFVLYGVGSDPVLLQRLGPLQWILQVGALLVPILAALVLCPPGTQRPPPDARGV